jgi:hypothetical protein
MEDDDLVRPALFVRNVPVDLTRPALTAEEYLLQVR